MGIYCNDQVLSTKFSPGFSSTASGVKDLADAASNEAHREKLIRPRLGTPRTLTEGRGHVCGGGHDRCVRWPEEEVTAERHLEPTAPVTFPAPPDEDGQTSLF